MTKEETTTVTITSRAKAGEILARGQVRCAGEPD